MTMAEPGETRPDIWRRYSPRRTMINYAWYFSIVFVAVWSVSNLDIPWFYFLDAHVQAADLLVRMYPPDWAHFGRIADPLLETIHIATLGTAITFVIAFPLAFLAARNTTPNATTWFIGRFILVTSRSVNTVVWGLLFVAMFGPGPVAGIWAVAARSIGFVGAGGIGIQLYASINQFARQEVSVMLLAVLAVVLVIEFVSATVRKHIT